MFKTNAYHIKLEGDNYTVGQTLGTMIKSVPGLSKAHILPAAPFTREETQKVLKLFDMFCPGLNEEIDGFCEVLKVPADRVLYYALSYLKPGCSQMALLSSKTESGHGVLARNYDFSEKMDDLTLCTTKITGRYAHISSSSVLFGRGDGLNECGLAVSMTSAGLPVSNMPGSIRKPMLEGLNFWVVIRAVLENCANVEEALGYTKEMPIAFNMNLMVLDKSDHGALIETFDGRWAIKSINDSTLEQFLCSTNHVCLPELSHLEQHKLKHSLIRYELIEKMCAGKETISKEDIKNLLTTRYPRGLNFPYYDELLGTLRSIIFNTSTGEVNLCFGSPDINEWHYYHIDDEIKQGVIPVSLHKETFGNSLFEMV